MKNRLVILVVAITVIAAMVGCSAGSLLARREDPTQTPTKTPKPTFTPTLPPTPTFTPTNTPVPTDTPLPTDTPTLTPAPTDTPTETPLPPTNTPKPPSKPKPKPTAVPTKKPQPTSPPAPQYEFSKIDQRNWPNCGSTGIKVFFKTSGGQIAPGRQFAVYAGGTCVRLSSWSNEGDGSADFILSGSGPRAGTWEIQVVQTESGSVECSAIKRVLSARVSVQTVDAPCDSDSTGVQWVWLTFKQN